MSSPDARTTPVDGGLPEKTYLVDGQQRYRVDARLGGGGFGAVFKCWHEQTATWVAIKRVHVTDGALGSLAHEATMLGLVDSEYVAKPRASFIDNANSLLYLVSDLAEEGDLRQYLHARPSPLPVKEAVELALGIARGLAALHAREIVHRDLKPANVLIFRRDQRVLPKLADFGLARSESSLSVGEFVSPGYSAPEQLAFERAGADSDRFAFGLLLYELLTGFPATDVRELSAYAAWLAGLKDRPLAAPSVRRPDLLERPALDRLVQELTTLDRAPRQRMSTSSIVAVLEQALSDSGVVLESPSPQQAVGATTASIASKKTSRARTIAVSAVLVAIVLSGFSLAGLWPLRGPGPSADLPMPSPGRNGGPSTSESPAIAATGKEPAQPRAERGGGQPGRSGQTNGSRGSEAPNTQPAIGGSAASRDSAIATLPAPVSTPAANAPPPVPQPTGPPDRGEILPSSSPVIDPSFRGKWTGTLNNPGGKSSLVDVFVELTGPDGALTGTVSLDGSRCRGTWQTKEAILRQIWFAQEVTGSDCVRHARVHTERVGEQLSVKMYTADSGGSMGSGLLARVVDGIATGTANQRSVPSWAIGNFVGSLCVDDGRDFDCRLSIKGDGQTTFSRWFRVAAEFPGGRPKPAPQQVACVWENERRINCSFGRGGYEAFDLSPLRDGVRMTRANGSSGINLRRDK